MDVEVPHSPPPSRQSRRGRARKNIDKPSYNTVSDDDHFSNDDQEDNDEDDDDFVDQLSPNKKTKRNVVEQDSPLVCTDTDGDDEPCETLEEARQKRHGGGAPIKEEGQEDKQKAKKNALQKQRRRRRSSARFLRLSGRFDDDDEVGAGKDKAALSEMYRQAIRMNAENKINAGNSWGLKLIENLDKFLVEDEENLTSGGGSNRNGKKKSVGWMGDSGDGQKRVNFSRASCTIDASVKIYSYRVDDVHLTSYKVLANLNRTDMGKSHDALETIAEGGEKPSSVNRTRKQTETRGNVETLETNIPSISMSKLDSAYDVDPLFHKMSKAFDEGGAKGLLLANLGVAHDNCAIVFDSKDEPNEESENQVMNSPKEELSDNEPKKTCKSDSTSVEQDQCDTTFLRDKVHSLLKGAEISSISLVPQLKEIREEVQNLEAEGFVDYKAPVKRSRRYATSAEEEKEAEISIHRDALERSRVSMTNVTFNTAAIDEDFGEDDYGGDDDDDDGDFGGFMDDSAVKYSSNSFNETMPLDDTMDGSTKKNITSQVLDILCDGDALNTDTQYGYFNAAAVEKMVKGNVWAGATHWKKCNKPSSKEKSKQTEKTPRKKSKKTHALVDLFAAPPDDLFAKPVKTKRSRTDPLQQSDAVKKKNKKEKNLLPFDAKVGVDQLSHLFLRPKAQLRAAGDEAKKKNRKGVGFLDVVTDMDMMFDDGGDTSFGDDGDGPGFAFCGSNAAGDFADADDFVVKELEGVRKVEKVEVGHAKVAKKVDVKRLKTDIWVELDSRVNDGDKSEMKVKAEPVECRERDDKEEKGILTPSISAPISFKELVYDLDQQQVQDDVTLPFYFICILHLANERGLKLEGSSCLTDFHVSLDEGAAPSIGTLPVESSQ